MKAIALIGMTAIACLTACSESSDSSGSTAPSFTLYANVEGRAYDIVSTKPVSGMLLTLGSFTTLTGIDGSYLFASVPRGSYTLSGNIAGYESYSSFVELNRDMTRSVALRRTRPYVRDFRVAGSIIYGTLVHLRGAATLDQPKSSVDYVTQTGTTHASLASALWVPIDATSVRVTFDTGKSGITEVDWAVRDTAGNFGRFVCRTDDGCSESAQ
jgi:hypothetical protein